MAAKLLMSFWGRTDTTRLHVLVSTHGSMNKDFQIRFTAGLLFLLTAAACVFAWINFQKEHEFQIPYDGAWWVERGGHLVADRVEHNGPADKAGIRQGDQLATVNGREVKGAPGLERQLYATGVWSKATYSVFRHSVPVDSVVILVPAER